MTEQDDETTDKTYISVTYPPLPIDSEYIRERENQAWSAGFITGAIAMLVFIVALALILKWIFG
jgi:hypothetical protein